MKKLFKRIIPCLLIVFSVFAIAACKDGSVYKPKGGPQIFVPIVMDVILEQWGGEMKIEAGGWLNITNPDDIYGISERDFYDTYRFVDDVTLTKTKKQNFFIKISYFK